ncbi:RicAFT regulatory complex protein RicA family protein [Aneurinibacillus aneurinilyticus]|nr:YlbF family regulator [Aneurinibacillus aneurinilyticus]MCI1692887.1 YlbF family regulator [Aneurinibacillus aneurinilyticus]MED0669781.1 YlbF family regulator [Aneurinibacillus aneurinilyticus]MED0705690.1 YlbF family regulator [Aneurinibacillus aneurinilyticus]MED0725841.1 YlbF family regulator [Aneurinibacillus aneurinilyticus]MED0732188.1 YlbF family regulator [Aneurinibacillus aneurinilyticus]
MEEKQERTFDYSSIMGQAKELATLIANSEEVERFKQAEKKISANARVQGLIAKIKQKQKQIVKLEHSRRYEEIPVLEQEIDTLQDELDSIPIVLEFKQTQQDINELLQIVTSVIANKVSENIIVSTGGDPLYNETGYPKAKPEGVNGCGSSGCGH